MRLALLSDIHANLPALEACLAAAREAGAERFVFLGDLVGYGPDPEAVVERISKLAASGAIVLRGNHDEAAVAPTNRMNAAAREAILWTRDHLSEDARIFLAQLPLSVADDDRLYVHADASQPSAWNYVTSPLEAQISLSACSARITFCGHVHVPAIYTLSPQGHAVGHSPGPNIAIPLLANRRWLAVLGAVGQPRDGDPAAAFSLFDTATSELTLRRVPYDVESVAARVRACGLPESLAARLLKGR
ncbi:MAG: metallophosphatase family protein [Proteobacteria bacterium]|nr:metallophosphatase family protein [Pseudomonadota bacterium]